MPRLSNTLEIALEKALSLAGDRNHEYSTLEHFLLGLSFDPDFLDAFDACAGDLSSLRSDLEKYIDEELGSLVVEKLGNVQPTASFQRVVQRAILHVESSGREEVSAANVFVSIFSERDSYAAEVLSKQDITRYDVVNYIAHGVAKRPRGASKPVTPPTGNPLELRNRVNEQQLVDRDEVIAKLTERAQEAERQLADALTKISNLEELNEALRSQVQSDQRDRPDIFLSYQRADRNSVAPLVAALRADKFSVWWDADIEPGAPWEQTIENFISISTIVIVCWSQAAVQSENVKAEARFARDREKLVQIFLDRAPPPLFFGERQGLVFDGWNGSTGDKCYRDLVFHTRRELLDLNSKLKTGLSDLSGNARNRDWKGN
ncbi:MAG: TIR domain-containing protein [Hyphomonas sp.]